MIPVPANAGPVEAQKLRDSLRRLSDNEIGGMIGFLIGELEVRRQKNRRRKVLHAE